MQASAGGAKQSAQQGAQQAAKGAEQTAEQASKQAQQAAQEGKQLFGGFKLPWQKNGEQAQQQQVSNRVGLANFADFAGFCATVRPNCLSVEVKF